MLGFACHFLTRHCVGLMQNLFRCRRQPWPRPFHSTNAGRRCGTQPLEAAAAPQEQTRSSTHKCARTPTRSEAQTARGTTFPKVRNCTIYYNRRRELPACRHQHHAGRPCRTAYGNGGTAAFWRHLTAGCRPQRAACCCSVASSSAYADHLRDTHHPIQSLLGRHRPAGG